MTETTSTTSSATHTAEDENRPYIDLKAAQEMLERYKSSLARSKKNSHAATQGDGVVPEADSEGTIHYADEARRILSRKQTRSATSSTSTPATADDDGAPPLPAVDDRRALPLDSSADAALESMYASVSRRTVAPRGGVTQDVESDATAASAGSVSGSSEFEVDAPALCPPEPLYSELKTRDPPDVSHVQLSDVYAGSIEPESAFEEDEHERKDEKDDEEGDDEDAAYADAELHRNTLINSLPPAELLTDEQAASNRYTQLQFKADEGSTQTQQQQLPRHQHLYYSIDELEYEETTLPAPTPAAQAAPASAAENDYVNPPAPLAQQSETPRDGDGVMSSSSPVTSSVTSAGVSQPIRFVVRPIGSLPMSAEDMAPTRSAPAVSEHIATLTRAHQNGSTLRDAIYRWPTSVDVWLELSGKSLSVVDPEKSAILATQQLRSIRLWGTGYGPDSRDFAFVSRDVGQTGPFLCHVFRCRQGYRAEQISATLREVCWKMQSLRERANAAAVNTQAAVRPSGSPQSISKATGRN